MKYLLAFTPFLIGTIVLYFMAYPEMKPFVLVLMGLVLICMIGSYKIFK